MSDIAFETPGAAAHSRNPLRKTVLRSMLGWTSGIGLRLLMLCALITLMRSPPGALR